MQYRTLRRLKMSGSYNAGYRHVHRDIFVTKEDAFDYALENCVEGPVDGMREIRWMDEFRDMLVEWFYSGNWIKEDKENGRV